MKKMFLLGAAILLALPLRAVILPFELEIDPEATSCQIVYRQVMKTLEYRPEGGEWIQLPLLKKSPVESSRWRGHIKNLKPETKYEVRAKNAQNRYICKSFVTQPLVPRKIFKLTPTFENCSFEIPDHEGKSCRVEYRRAGGKWQSAASPVWFPDERCWRGALFLLTENSSYEIRAAVSGSKISGKFSTRSSKFPVGKTVVIKKLPFTVSESGTPDAYIRYTAEKTLKGSLVLKNIKYVILDGVRLDGNSTHTGIQLIACQDVAITNCEIFNCGAASVRSWNTKTFGQYCYSNQKKRLLYGSGCLRITDSSNILVERCLFRNPSGKSNSWQYAHPIGPEGLVMDCARSGVVVRYNDFAARDLARWNDCIASIGNGCSDGGFGSNADIYGNYFSFSNDDACELEGAGRNLRFYSNRIEQVFAGVSTGRCSYGPVYIFRNLLVNNGDQHGNFGSSLKNGMQAQGKGTVFFWHNTVAASHGGMSWIFASYHRKAPIIPLPQYKGVSRGNIFVSRQNIFPDNFFQWPGDYDCDVFAPGSSSFEKFLKKNGQEKNAVRKKVQFTDPAKGDYSLVENSPGWKLNTLSFFGGIKHAGAVQEKGVHAQLNRDPGFTADAAYGSTKGEEIIFTVTPQKETPFEVKVNDDFYSVYPMKGIFKAGVPQKFTVRTPAGKTPLCRIYRGVFFVRRPDGLSLPLGIAFDRRNNPVSGYEIPNGGSFSLPREEACFIYIKGHCWNGKAVLELDQKKIDVRLGPVKRDGIEFIRLYDLKTGKLLRLTLKSGKHTLKAAGDKKSALKIKSLVVTTDPDLIYNGKLQEEGK